MEPKQEQQQLQRCLLFILPKELLIIVLEYIQTISHVALLEEALISSMLYRQRWLQFLDGLKCAALRDGVYKCLDSWQWAIKRKVNLKNAKFNVFGMTSEDSLFWACERGLLTVVHHVVTVLGHPVHFKKRDGETMLHYACKGGNIEIVRLLLDRGLDRVNEVGQVTRRPPLSYAVQCASTGLPLVRLLLERGAVIELKDKRGHTAFDHACLNGRIDIAAEFLKDSTADSAVAVAPVAVAAAATSDDQDGEEVVALARAPASSTLLQRVVTGGLLGVAHSPLVLAATNDHRDMVLWLLETGVGVNSQGDLGDTALHCASKLGHSRTVQVLLDTPRVNVQATNDFGNTPLHYAARNGHVQVVKMLLSRGGAGDCLAPNKELYTPLSLAREFRRSEVLACMGVSAEPAAQSLSQQEQQQQQEQEQQQEQQQEQSSIGRCLCLRCLDAVGRRRREGAWWYYCNLLTL